MLIGRESVRDEDQREIAVISLAREYGSTDSDLLTALEERLQAELGRLPAALLLDFSATSYIGCGLLNVVVRCHAQSRAVDCSIAVCGMRPLPERMLTITRLDSILGLFRTRRAAITTLRRSRFWHADER